MLHTKSESDITSLAPSSPSRSPKRPVYYVQSPSRDSLDGDKSSSMHPTPNFNSPMESPLHHSFGRHSRNSSSSRFSGIFRSSSGRKGGRKRNDKGWPECNVIVEEGDYDDESGFSRRFQALIVLLSFVLLFTMLCLIIWGAARPFKVEAVVKSLTINNLYIGTGSDFTGVPTKILIVNGSLRLSIYNPATFFGIQMLLNFWMKNFNWIVLYGACVYSNSLALIVDYLNPFHAYDEGNLSWLREMALLDEDIRLWSSGKERNIQLQSRSTLLGLPCPANSVGNLPLGYINLNEAEEVEAMLANAKQWSYL